MSQNHFKHLDPVKNYFFKIGGLSFNQPKLAKDSIMLKSNLNNDYSDIIDKNKNNPIIKNVGKNVTLEMGKSAKTPIQIMEIVLPNVHRVLSKFLKRSGTMDMWVKKSGEDKIIIPKELEIISEILKKSYEFEKAVNENATNWNMWLLIDVRKVKKGHTQRNCGYHFDGLKIGGYHKGSKVTSIYSWCNKLPTRFFTGKVIFPKNFNSKYNANIIAQKQIKKNDEIFDSEPNNLYRFDGATVHTGIECESDINDRVFIRICFTPPNVLFNRLGNTKNPCFEYPSNWKWRKVCDPSISFKNSVKFEFPEEFKNLWDICCLGHPAFSMRHEGVKSYEYELMTELKCYYGPKFVKNVVKLYENADKNSELNILRCKMLLIKYYQ
jgi:hypothetical protein